MNPNESLLDPARDAMLDAQLGELRRAMQSVAAPAALEGALAANFRRRNGKAKRPNLWWLPPLAMAATIALVSWMIRGPVPPMKSPRAKAWP